jgi:hypothetical protein
LVINDESANYQGLFGRASGGSSGQKVIKDLSVDCKITAGNRVGGLVADVAVGYLSYSISLTIENCSTSGEINGIRWVGGLVGYGMTYDSSASFTIKDCHSTSAVTASQSDGGGVAGGLSQNCAVTDCYSTGAVKGGSYIGGVIGLIEGTAGIEGAITRCFSAGAVTASQGDAGGVAAWIWYANMENCYSTGVVKGGGYAAGVANVAEYSSMTDCYSAGAVIGGDYVGGVAGELDANATIENCAAINPIVAGDGANVDRVVGCLVDGTSIITGGYAFDGMIADVAGSSDENSKHGGDRGKEDFLDADFWTGIGWDGTAIWNIIDGALPTLKDLGGQSGALPQQFTKPTVTGATPTGAGADVLGSVVVIFDRAMGQAAGVVKLNSLPPLAGPGSWNGDKTAYTIAYAGLAYSTQYTVTISGFKDQWGNEMAAISTHQFTTRANPGGGTSGSGSGGASGSGGGGGGCNAGIGTAAVFLMAGAVLLATKFRKD